MSELQAEFYQKLLEHLEALGNRLSSIEKLLSAESKPQEPEWRPMSEAPRGYERIKVKSAKTGEEYFAFFFVDGWICSRSQHPEDNTFLFFDSQLSGWRPL